MINLVVFVVMSAVPPPPGFVTVTPVAPVVTSAGI